MASTMTHKGQGRKETVKTTYTWKIKRFVEKMQGAQALVNRCGPQAVSADPDLKSDSFFVTLGAQMVEMRASIGLKPFYGYVIVVVEQLGCATEGGTKKANFSVIIRSIAGFDIKPVDVSDGWSGKMLHESYFLKDAVKANCNSNGVLEVWVTVEAECDEVLHVQDRELKVPSKLMKGCLAKRLWDNRESTGDVTLVCCDCSVKVHKLVLITMSDTFDAMFSHQDLAESQTGQINIKDMDPNCLEEFVYYIYTDKFMSGKLPTSTLIGLLVAADKYLIDSLKIKCQHELSKKLKVSNVCEMIALAEMYNATYLKDSAINYLSQHFKHVVKNPSSNWDKLPSDIAKDVLEHLAEK